MFSLEKVEEILKTKERWTQEELLTLFQKKSAIKEKFTTISDMEVPIISTPSDIKDLDYLNDLGMPGEFPYTRGVHPSMYRGKLWTMRQFAGFGTAEDTNKRFKFLLEQGQTGLSTAFHFPTLMGYDSDHEKSIGEVGKVGVAIDSLADMEILFDGIPLDKVSTSMTINGPASILLAMYIVVAEKQGVSADKIMGTTQNDILKEYIAQKSWIFPPEPSMRLITDMFEYSTNNIPKWNTISISGYHIREAGSTAIQELAFTIADGIEYVEYALKRGLDIDDFAPRLSFFFDAHSDFFEEVAKFRAARRMWARIMKERFKAKNKKSLLMRFHTQTAGVSLTAQQPENNIVRIAMQALSAVMGGTQSLHTNSMDETLALPTQKSVTIALRTQQIIAEETGVANTIDPLAGSYFVEELTNKIEEEALKYIDKIDKMGGMVRAIEKGFPQLEIGNASYKYQRQIENKEKIQVGVNKYKHENEKIDMNILKIDPKTEKKQISSLKELRAKRDNDLVSKNLLMLKEKAKTSENLMPFIINAVRSYATLGEMIETLKQVFGEHKDPGYL
jgi:methylmalonyl-CoA mutase N-terminal domain/subunit